jgi:hypothetical protein
MAVLLEASEMIISNRFVRTYLFGSQVARIHNKSFQCCVSTAKEGLFQKQSTIILEPKIGSTVGAGAAGLRPCGKVIYSPTLRTSDRFQLHDAIVKTLDALGEEGCTLEEALEQTFADLKRRDIAVTTMNFAVDQGQADWQDDYTQKALWYRNAAEQGDVRAQYNIGYLYRNGKGVPQDFAKAYFWFDLATAAEQDASLLEQTTKCKATKHRDEAAFHLTPANLSREQERARKWFEAHQAKP